MAEGSCAAAVAAVAAHCDVMRNQGGFATHMNGVEPCSISDRTVVSARQVVIGGTLSPVAPD